MNIIDSIMFLVILAGFGLGLAYFGVGFRAIRETKRPRSFKALRARALRRHECDRLIRARMS